MVGLAAKGRDYDVFKGTNILINGYHRLCPHMHLRVSLGSPIRPNISEVRSDQYERRPNSDRYGGITYSGHFNSGDFRSESQDSRQSVSYSNHCYSHHTLAILHFLQIWSALRPAAWTWRQNASPTFPAFLACQLDVLLNIHILYVRYI